MNPADAAQVAHDMLSWGRTSPAPFRRQEA
jgi:hypothetical protein